MRGRSNAQRPRNKLTCCCGSQPRTWNSSRAACSSQGAVWNLCKTTNKEFNRGPFGMWSKSIYFLIENAQCVKELLSCYQSLVVLSDREKKLNYKSESCSVVSDPLKPHGLYSPWNSLGQNTGVVSLSLLQGIFPNQGSNPGFPHCRQIPYQLSHKGSPYLTIGHC